MKNTLHFRLFIVVLLMFVSCSKEETYPTDQIAGEPLDMQEEPFSKTQIDEIIEKELSAKGEFNWNSVSDKVLWSAVKHSEEVLTIGYNGDNGGFENKNSSTALNAKNNIIELVRKLEDKNPDATEKSSKVLLYDDATLTLIDVRATNMATIAELRKNKDIRYLEPAGYPFLQQTAESKSDLSSLGCGFEGEVVRQEDFIPILPNAKMPWNFPLHNIDRAWDYSTGSGITIGVVDTGLSAGQSLLGTDFGNGYSNTGRTIESYGVYVDSFWPWSTKTDGPDDKCGHGTSMSAAATAPRNDMGLPVGVAYNADLLSYRAAKDVLLNGYHEQKGVARAITELGARDDVKIISMSMGYVFSVGRIADAIRYAHAQGKLIFCAGGTSTSFTNFVGVIFPASMSETVAVTGVREQNSYNECEVCHKGSAIDFTMIMERASGEHVPTLGYYNAEEDYVGGSSVATASAAGIAALVWSRNPEWSREAVLDKMIRAADLYPNRDSDYGWGNLDALKAVQ